MKTIIAGSRTITDYQLIEDCCQLENITEVVSGTARGVDKLGEQYANNHNIPVKLFPANWDYYGKSAGYKRNEEMADYADQLIAFWDGNSRGTEHMIRIAQKKGLRVVAYDINCFA